MGLAELERQADALLERGRRLRAERRAHARRGMAILRERIATPAALAWWFVAGLLVGGRRPRPPRDAPRQRRRARKDGAQALAGTLATLAIRLASSFLAGAGPGASGVPQGPLSDASPPPPSSRAPPRAPG